jgi:hypothetical protein
MSGDLLQSLGVLWSYKYKIWLIGARQATDTVAPDRRHKWTAAALPKWEVFIYSAVWIGHILFAFKETYTMTKQYAKAAAPSYSVSNYAVKTGWILDVVTFVQAFKNVFFRSRVCAGIQS